MLVLGIESSCDETAASVVRNGCEILSSIITSQIDLHRPWGGVVPELASREHLEKIEAIVDKALADAGISKSDLDGIAVTQGPGLIGSLLVGVCYAKALAYALGIPIVGVNHIEGHFFSVVFENPPIEYPVLALIVSGGHTNIFLSPEAGVYRLVSRTRDDAAGEAFDKVAKMLGLGYPGGPIIERLSRSGNDRAVKFPQAKISDGKPDLSFSGLKTAVARYVSENDISPVDPGGEANSEIVDLAASFQRAVVTALTSTLRRLAVEHSPRTLIVAGGVACNQALRDGVSELGQDIGVPVYFPSKELSTDNAAMIAAAGFERLVRGESSDLHMTADVTIRLQNVFDPSELSAKGRLKYRT